MTQQPQPVGLDPDVDIREDDADQVIELDTPDVPGDVPAVDDDPTIEHDVNDQVDL